MRVIEPVTVTDAILTDSNVPENDHAAWSIATAYTAGQRVILTSTHSVYEAVINNTGNNPATDNGTNWLRIGATNRWKAFDGKIGDKVTKSGLISYELTLASPAQAVALFGLTAATVEVTVTDPVDGVTFNETVSMIDGAPVVDWFTYFYEPITYRSVALFTGVPGFTGSEVLVEVSSSGTTEVGQIVFGPDRALGTTTAGTETGILDFTTVARDEFGDTTIVERAYADEVTFQFAVLSQDVDRVKAILTRLRAKPAVYFAGPDTEYFATTVYGVRGPFRVPLAGADVSFATLEVEGLT